MGGMPGTHTGVWEAGAPTNGGWEAGAPTNGGWEAYTGKRGTTLRRGSPLPKEERKPLRREALRLLRIRRETSAQRGSPPPREEEKRVKGGSGP